MKSIDIFTCAYLRPNFTEQTILYLKERTKYPYRLFVIDNGGNEEVTEKYKDDIFMTIKLSKNAGPHAAWNIALALAESDYFITSDNDIYVPDLEPDWLTQLVKLMDERPDFGAISLHPHVLIGDVSFDPNDPEDVKEVPWCGGVMRIMRKEAVKKTDGWKTLDQGLIQANRGNEERTICTKLKQIGYKSGRCTRLRAYHPFGSSTKEPWGYPKELDQQKLGHNPGLTEYVWQFDNMEAYDNKTWLPKK